MYISVYIVDEKVVKLFKAPHGFIYRLYEITMSYASGTAGQVYVLDYGKHELTDFSIVGLAAKNCLCGAAFSSSVPINSNWSFHGLVDTKFITVVSAEGNNAGVLVVIIAELVKISRENALLEYFMKSR